MYLESLLQEHQQGTTACSDGDESCHNSDRSSGIYSDDEAISANTALPDSSLSEPTHLCGLALKLHKQLQLDAQRGEERQRTKLVNALFTDSDEEETIVRFVESDAQEEESREI